MDFGVLNNQQRQKWDIFADGLSKLNHHFYKIRFDLWWIKKAMKFYKSQTEEKSLIPINEELLKIEQIGKKWMHGVITLNNAFSLSQSGNAYLTQSKGYNDDLDLVVEPGTLPDDIVKNATFDSSSLGFAPVIPLVVKGAIVLGSLLIVSGIATTISDTLIKQKRISGQIARLRANVEKSMKNANPAIYNKWAAIKKAELEPAENSFMENLTGTTGGILGVAIVAGVLFLAWKIFKDRR